MPGTQNSTSHIAAVLVGCVMCVSLLRYNLLVIILVNYHASHQCLCCLTVSVAVCVGFYIFVNRNAQLAAKA